MEIHVLGLGDSIKTYQPKKLIPTIGVNNIYQFVKTDYVVCLDRMRRFSHEKLKIIKSSTPIKFYSHLSEWTKVVQNFELITLAMPRGDVKQLDSPKIIYSICSPYVACIMAYKLGADRIVLNGVDLLNHPSFNSSTERLNRIRNDFKVLRGALCLRGVELMVGNTYTSLFPTLPFAG